MQLFIWKFPEKLITGSVRSFEFDIRNICFQNIGEDLYLCSRVGISRFALVLSIRANSYASCRTLTLNSLKTHKVLVNTNSTYMWNSSKTLLEMINLI